jgi:hypothetical protein
LCKGNCQSHTGCRVQYMYLPCIAKIHEVCVNTFTVHDSQYETDSSSLILAMHGKYMYCTRQSVWDWQLVTFTQTSLIGLYKGNCQSHTEWRVQYMYLSCSVKINEVCVKLTVSLILTVVYSTCIYHALLKSMRNCQSHTDCRADSSSLILAMHGKYMYCTRQSVWDWQFLIDFSNAW